MGKLVKLILISVLVITIVTGTNVNKNKVDAEMQPELIITPMNYDKWYNSRMELWNAGKIPSPPEMTRSEWNERGYY